MCDAATVVSGLTSHRFDHTDLVGQLRLVPEA
jgi:hypothetical protein